jgi:type IV pilus assembly protein PilB
LYHPLGHQLVEKGLITAEQLETALTIQKTTPRLLGSILLEMGHIGEEDLLQIISNRFNLPIYRFNGDPIDQDTISSIPIDIVQKHKCVPLERENGRIKLAIGNPKAAGMLEEVRFATGCEVQPVLCLENEILDAIEKYYDITVEKIIGDMALGENGDSESDEYFIHDLQEKASEPTLVNLINLLITEAIADGASDIHVEPFEREMKIKYRIDGILHELPPPPKNLQPAIVSRIKIMAGMDIAKRHIPQDGHIRINMAETQVDIRVATIPTIFGEMVVMRLLNKKAIQFGLEQLGLSDDTYRRFNLLLGRSHGIVLVCGPTGCGKTTTLYAALRKIYTPEKKIITIEDPVEYQLPGVNQIPVRAARGLSFANGLRAILRQDPDILMVGEVRDVETAEISIRSALTGHLIFSTIHTNDAASAITRLLDMGLEPFLIASSLQGVLGQRLVRKLCPHCRKPVKIDKIMLAHFRKTEDDVRDITAYAPAGCEACKNRGYLGRIGIYELLLINEDLQQMILNRESSHIIKNRAMMTMTTMRDDGWQKICQGITSFEEVLRQTQSETLENDITTTNG